jgi:hypothetical protein
MINTTQLQISIVVLLASLSTGGCTFLGLPWQYSAASSVADVVSINNSGKSIAEEIASSITKTDCQWNRVIKNWNVCLTEEEYLEDLLGMNCETYSWDFLNIPYCRESRNNV